MNLIGAMIYVADGPTTGGNLYNSILFQAWEPMANTRLLDIRRRWFHLGVPGLAWIVQYGRSLDKTDWLVQAASGTFHSRALIKYCRRFHPSIRHLGIAHHPRWLENPAHLSRERKLYNSFDRILTTANHVRSELCNQGVNVPIDILTPGYTPAKNPVAAKPSGRPKILWNGHLLPRKGALIVLEALKSLLDFDWQVQFVATSQNDPDYRAKFQKEFLALQKAFPGRFEFAGRQSFERYLQILTETDYYCFPSVIEGSSVAVVEAMSHGCTVLLPKIPTFVELLGTPEFAGFFEPLTPAGLAESLRHLLSDPQEAVKCKEWTTRRIKQLPDWDAFKVNAGRYLQSTLRHEDIR